jgi:glycine/D-amino acid oxidase-like deaminating enzyme
VALLEAQTIGWGAAGRNGGQVNAGLKKEPDEIVRDLGSEYGPRLAAFSLAAPDRLFRLVEDLGISCGQTRSGTLRVASSERHVKAVARATEQWVRHGAHVEFWGREKVQSALGSMRHRGGMFNAGGGAVNPLALVRGLARAALRAGAGIYTRTPALSVSRTADGWEIRTPQALARARRVLLATQAYTDGLWPGLRTSIVPAFSSIVATEPLPDRLAARVLRGSQVVYEAGDITAYFRRDADNRLLMGGRGVQRPAHDLSDYRHLIAFATRLWPALADVRWTHWWNGQLAMSADTYPRFHCVAPDLFVILGYARGVAFGTVIGDSLAALLAGDSPDLFVLPTTRVRRIPFHAFWKAAVGARMLYGRVRDAMGV